MIDWSLIVAVLVVALIGGAITGAVSLAIGGMGVTRGLRTRVDQLQERTERTNERITREVKTRAGDAATTKRTDAQLREQAIKMQSESVQDVNKRPTPLRRT